MRFLHTLFDFFERLFFLVLSPFKERVRIGSTLFLFVFDLFSETGRGLAVTGSPNASGVPHEKMSRLAMSNFESTPYSGIGETPLVNTDLSTLKVVRELGTNLAQVSFVVL